MKYIENTTEWVQSDLENNVEDGWVKIRQEFDELYEIINKIVDHQGILIKRSF